MKSETLCTRICQAPGGHNVIAGIYDGIKAWNKDIRRLSGDPFRLPHIHLQYAYD